MKTIAIHGMLKAPLHKRESRMFWVSDLKFKKMSRKSGKHCIEVLDERPGKKKVRLTWEDVECSLKKKVFIACNCGFKGNAFIYSRATDKVYKQRIQYEIRCPHCHNKKFEIEYSYLCPFQVLTFAEMYEEEGKISLSMGFQSYHFHPHYTQEGETTRIQTFNTNIRLTYNTIKKQLYWSQPKQKFVRNLGYGSIDNLQIHFLNVLMNDKEKRELMFTFLTRCLVKANVHPQKIFLLLKEAKESPQCLFSKYHDAISKKIFPLLIRPQLQAIDETCFIISVATAPRRLKEKIKLSNASIHDIFRNMFGFSNKRLLRFYNQDVDNLIVVDFLRPLFKNDTFLLDVATEINTFSEYFWKHMRNFNIDSFSTRAFLVSQKLRESRLPYLRLLRKRFKSELQFRNSLLQLLRSHICNGNFNSFMNYLNDVEKLENELLSIFPPSRLPRRASIIDLHDAYVSLVNENLLLLDTLADEDEKHKPFLYNDRERSLEYQNENYTISLVQTSKELSDIGIVLDNCVRLYKEDIIDKKSYILTLQIDGIPQVCIEVSDTGIGWSLKQCSSKENEVPDSVYHDTLREWAEEKNISDHLDLLSFKKVDSMNRQELEVNDFPYAIEQRGGRFILDDEFELPF